MSGPGVEKIGDKETPEKKMNSSNPDFLGFAYKQIDELRAELHQMKIKVVKKEKMNYKWKAKFFHLQNCHKTVKQQRDKIFVALNEANDELRERAFGFGKPEFPGWSVSEDPDYAYQDEEGKRSMEVEHDASFAEWCKKCGLPLPAELDMYDDPEEQQEDAEEQQEWAKALSG